MEILEYKYPKTVQCFSKCTVFPPLIVQHLCVGIKNVLRVLRLQYNKVC